MEIPKPSEDDKQFFRSILPEDPEVEVKPMFGNLGAFVHGTRFAGLFGSAVGVRLAGPDAAELSAVEGTGPFGPAERPMGGYLSLPPGMDQDLARTVSVSFSANLTFCTAKSVVNMARRAGSRPNSSW